MAPRTLAALAAALFLAAWTVPAAAEDSAAVSALKQRIERLRAALAGDVCADPTAARALLATPVEGAAAGVDTSTAAAAGQAAPPSKGAADKPLSRKELVDHLHQTVVMVIAGRDTGSGFFVTPDTVLTNNHVVENAGTSPIVVVGPSLGGPRPATLLARTGTKGQNERDYAILKVQGAPSTAVLPLATGTTELASVIAAGFPGLLLDNDMNFRALIRGDMTAMPDLALSQGAIMAIQNKGRGLTTLAHSAPISGGNSGGPLVDACGRAIGINTFINVAVQQASSAGFAIATPDVIAYLKEHGVAPILRDDSCGE